METKGNKILKNVKTRWMSMLDPLKGIMVEYKPLLAIMQTNQNFIQMANASEMPHVQTIFYDSQIFETYQLFFSNLIKSNKI
jgi:hypothetical protein